MKEVKAAQGQTWDMIAKMYMGDEVFTKDVMLENPELSDVTIFDGGETINIPETTDIEDEE